MNIAKFSFLPSLVLLALFISGCAGTNAFNDYARAGDTVALAAGYTKTFTKNNIQIEIFPSDYDASTNPDSIVIPPGDPSIRVVTNMYIDPVSSIVVSKQTKQDLSAFARQYNDSVRSYFTGGDKDWWNTLIMFDTPATLPTGLTQIVATSISDPSESVTMNLQIIPGTGSPSSMSAQILGPLTQDELDSLQRVSHYTVDFTGSTLPYAIEVDLSHDADVDNGGVGRAYVINPVGFLKSANWSDDGYNTKVILMPTRDGEVKQFQDFKFYVAGGATNVQIANVMAYDINGAPVTGVSAAITAVP